jgi:hypothetical protein
MAALIAAASYLDGYAHVRASSRVLRDGLHALGRGSIAIA